MTIQNDSNDKQTTTNDSENKPDGSAKKDEQNATAEQSGDPGRTPGSAEGDEETVDEDIRQKEAEGKL